jgi:hypothetical protein
VPNAAQCNALWTISPTTGTPRVPLGRRYRLHRSVAESVDGLLSSCNAAGAHSVHMLEEGAAAGGTGDAHGELRRYEGPGAGGRMLAMFESARAADRAAAAMAVGEAPAAAPAWRGMGSGVAGVRGVGPPSDGAWLTDLLHLAILRTAAAAAEAGGHAQA